MLDPTDTEKYMYYIFIFYIPAHKAVKCAFNYLMTSKSSQNNEKQHAKTIITNSVTFV